MRIRYLIKLQRPILLGDHWPIPLLSGQLHFICEGAKATAIEVTFTGQPTDLSPRFEKSTGGRIKGTITHRDTLLPFVRMQLSQAFAFLQCYFNVEILISEIECHYIGETEEEEKRIIIKSSGMTRPTRALSMSFDLVTRALMAAENKQAPEFEATLVNAARKEIFERRYIDSFRYSFLLIEALYGDGKFKSDALKGALKENAEFRDHVTTELRETKIAKQSTKSDTDRLLTSSPTIDDVISHLVEMRGFYFHGNIKRKGAWLPQQQHEAETLAFLSIGIASRISAAAAAPMFDDVFSRRHFDQANLAGAMMSMTVDFKFREPTDPVDQTGRMNIRVPGTKVTARMSLYVLKQFLADFENQSPVAELKSATCKLKEGDKVFDIELHGATTSE